MILDDVFQFLNNTGLAPSHAIFSTEYLGHSARYYDYLRCSGAQPSLHCLVKVTGQLQRIARAETTGQEQAERANSLSKRTMSYVIERCD
jgi:hypothetical protein